MACATVYGWTICQTYSDWMHQSNARALFDGTANIDQYVYCFQLVDWIINQLDNVDPMKGT